MIVNPPRAPQARGAMVAGVECDGIAAELGIAAGDRIVEICGRPPRDILDYLFETSPALITMRVVKPDGQELAVEIEKEEGEPLGITVSEETFDGVRACCNDCLFCFVGQLPQGLRRSLYLRDDDLRLSVLHGNFVTLTNLTAADWARLEEQRLSPLHVSIHTTAEELRRRLLRNEAAPPILDQLRRVLALGIEVHGQIVLIPGLNDGKELDRTLEDLLALEPPLASLAVVPVGLTRHGPATFSRHGPADARALVQQLAPWQERFEAAGGTLYAADEWYLLGGVPMPTYADYGAFPQLSNGVGMTRLFVRDLARAALRLPAALACPRRVAVVTGALFGPMLESLLARSLGSIDGLELRTVACSNELFGSTVTVAGLLGGADALRHMRPLRSKLDAVVLPAEMFRAAGDLTLDDYSLEQLRCELGIPVTAAASPRELIQAILGQPELRVRTRKAVSR